MLEQYLVRHCAPTLAGLKTASLFNCQVTSKEELRRDLVRWNASLRSKGVALALIAVRGGRALIYVYRKKRLLRDWRNPGVQAYLVRHGYSETDVEANLQFLAGRIMQEDGFPHEIGLFLGYPFEDVIAFIENEGKNCKCCGYWKVYCNEWEAQRQFEKFKKCTHVYCRCFLQGTPITRLTVAA